MSKLGMRRLMGLHYYVRDLERSRHFYVDTMDFAEIGRSSADLERDGHQRSLLFQAGEIVITCSSPVGSNGRAARYLAKHPDGIGTIAFEVDDASAAFAILDRNGGTPISEILRQRDAHGEIATFSITTPFGDTTFRFIERRGYRGLFPGMMTYDAPRGGRNRLAFRKVDHVTSNFETMAPALLWLEHVLGFQPFWAVEFHTRDGESSEAAVDASRAGSGLRSKVMWEPTCGIKFANNEPHRPAFKRSQVNVFHEEHRGDGVQHVALTTDDIVATVRELRDRGLPFVSTPALYYDLLPGRLAKLGLTLEEPLDELRNLEILVDGSGPGAYLLQIFLKDSAGLYGSREAGPFFFELIQRRGDSGFGAGNFRALFESIERAQAEGKTG